MALAVINKTIDIPNAILVNVDHNFIGDRGYTALGNHRQDAIAIRDIWVIRARYITKAKYDEIVNYLKGIIFGETDFWLDSFGGDASTNSIKADIEITSDQRTPFSNPDGSGWEKDGRTIELTIRQKTG